jgi:hypothetical protein
MEEEFDYAEQFLQDAIKDSNTTEEKYEYQMSDEEIADWIEEMNEYSVESNKRDAELDANA